LPIVIGIVLGLLAVVILTVPTLFCALKLNKLPFDKAMIVTFLLIAVKFIILYVGIIALSSQDWLNHWAFVLTAIFAALIMEGVELYVFWQKLKRPVGL
jgi:hypothetical protein